MSDVENKRKNRRFDCLVPIDSKSGDIFDLTSTVDISKQGIGFVTSREVPLNNKVTIALELSEEDMPVFVVGRVRWVRRLRDSENFRIGLSFDSVMRGSKTRLDRHFQGKGE